MTSRPPLAPQAGTASLASVTPRPAATSRSHITRQAGTACSAISSTASPSRPARELGQHLHGRLARQPPGRLSHSQTVRRARPASPQPSRRLPGRPSGSSPPQRASVPRQAGRPPGPTSRNQPSRRARPDAPRPARRPPSRPCRRARRAQTAAPRPTHEPPPSLPPPAGRARSASGSQPARQAPGRPSRRSGCGRLGQPGCPRGDFGSAVLAAGQHGDLGQRLRPRGDLRAAPHATSQQDELGQQHRGTCGDLRAVPHSRLARRARTAAPRPVR